MNIAICSDLHTNIAKRSEEARRIFDWIIDDAEKRGVDLFAIPGDLFDRPPTQADSLWLANALKRAADIAPVYILAGNHDVEFCFRVMARQKAKYPIYLEEGASVQVITTRRGEEVAIAGVAFPHKGKLLAAIGDAGPERVNEVAVENLETVFRGLGLQLDAMDCPKLCLVHGTIIGSKISKDNDHSRLFGMDIGLMELGLVGADFYTVGHIHMAQEFWTPQGAQVLVPGAPFHCNFGEQEEKSYIWLNLDREGRVIAERVPTPCTPMVLLEGEYRPESNDFALSKDGQATEGADIRFRYVVSSEHRNSARQAAERLAQELQSNGKAFNVTPDEKIIPTTKAKIPELSRAVTLEEKLEVYRQSIDKVPDPRTAVWLKTGLIEIQRELVEKGITFTTEGRTAPSLTKVRGNGWLKFREGFEIDIDALIGPLTTIVAPNESGKTLLATLMLPGALYGSLPSQVSDERLALDDVATARDSFIEIEFQMNGQSYYLRQICDGLNRKGNVDLRRDGKPILTSGGRAEFQKMFVDKELLPWTIFNTLVFWVSKPGVLGMTTGERVSLLLRILGIEHYEDIVKSASERARAVGKKVDEVAVRLDALGVDDLETLRAEHGSCGANVTVGTARLSSAERALEKLREDNRKTETELTAYSIALAKRFDVKIQRRQLEGKIADWGLRILESQEIVDTADSIRLAVERSAELQEELKRLANDKAELNTKIATANAERRAIQARQAQANTADSRLRQTIAKLDELLKEREAVAKAQDEIPKLRQLLETAGRGEVATQGTFERVQGERAVSAEGRVTFLRQELGVIRDGVENPQQYAEDALTSDDLAAKDAESHPERINRARRAWASARGAMESYRAELNAAEATAGKAGELERAEQEREGAQAQLVEVQNQLAQLANDLAKQGLEISALNGALGDVQDEITIVTVDIEEVAPVASKATALAEAETRIAGYREEIARAKKELEALVLPDLPPTPPTPVDLTSFQKEVSSAQAALTAAESALAVAAHALKDAEGREKQRESIRTELRPLEEQQAVWTRLAQEFKALQREEISCACGEIIEDTNDFLQAVGDNRHTLVRIDIEKPYSGTRGRKGEMQPCLDFVIFDSEEGLEKEAARLSGAGMQMVGTPLTCALVLAGCRRAGVKGVTLFFDEFANNCDPDNAVRAVGALREFARRLDARIFYVSQQPSIQDLADSRIELREGKVVVA